MLVFFHVNTDWVTAVVSEILARNRTVIVIPTTTSSKRLCLGKIKTFKI